ncbi:hypothetical protein NBRC116592_16570 [Colwellia sp. KU-HH00111]|uniref:PKD domain-containing protein n=1 Tax=Colwellia sp. KU-HH00111 TaxID=3127652 RepID=UPI0031063C9D
MKNIFVAALLLSTLTACGGSGSNSVSDSSKNQAPVANAGIDQNVVTTSVVILDASASSDSDGDTLSYSWSLTSLPENSGASLTNSTEASPTFTTDIDGSYVAQLIVNDGTENSVADTVTIVATTPNSVPVAEAGTDQNVVTTTIVTLDASASSDSDGDTLSYSWSLTSLPENSIASLSDSSSAVPTFTVDLDGKYVAQLVVNDGTENSVADTVIILAETANSIPVANAGNDQNQSIHNVNFSKITLDGSASSDADHDTLTYAWSLVTKPEGSYASLTDSTNVTIDFMADLEGDYIFSLTVNDGELTSEADNVTISFSTYNSTPTVNSGSNQTQFDFSEVKLNGTGNDYDSDLLTYEWSFKSKPAGSVVYLNDKTSLTPTFIPDVYGDYVLSLIANDGYEDSLEGSVVISVKNEAEKGDYLASNISGYTFSKSTSNINGSVTGTYGFIVKNENTQSLNWTRLTVVDANGTTVTHSTDPSLLGGNGVLSPDESQSLTISFSSAKLPLTAKYEFIDSTNSAIWFIVDKVL